MITQVNELDNMNTYKIKYIKKFKFENVSHFVLALNKSSLFTQKIGGQFIWWGSLRITTSSIFVELMKFRPTSAIWCTHFHTYFEVFVPQLVSKHSFYPQSWWTLGKVAAGKFGPQPEIEAEPSTPWWNLLRQNRCTGNIADYYSSMLMSLWTYRMWI